MWVVVLFLVGVTIAATWYGAARLYGDRIEVLRARLDGCNSALANVERSGDRAGSQQPAATLPALQPTEPCTEFATVSPPEILQRGLDATPSDRPRVWQAFAGQCVRWRLVYKSLHEQTNAEGALTGVAAAGFTNDKDRWDQLIIVRTVLEHSPDLKSARMNDLLQVEGRILSVEVDQIDLIDATVSRVQAAVERKQ